MHAPMRMATTYAGMAIPYVLGGLGIYLLAIATLLAFGVYTSPQLEWTGGLAWLCG